MPFPGGKQTDRQTDSWFRWKVWSSLELKHESNIDVRDLVHTFSFVFCNPTPQATETSFYLDNVINERVSEHPVQCDGVTLHQVLRDRHTHTHVGHSVQVSSSVTDTEDTSALRGHFCAWLKLCTEYWITQQSNGVFACDYLHAAASADIWYSFFLPTLKASSSSQSTNSK